MGAEFPDKPVKTVVVGSGGWRAAQQASGWVSAQNRKNVVGLAMGVPMPIALTSMMEDGMNQSGTHTRLHNQQRRRPSGMTTIGIPLGEKARGEFQRRARILVALMHKGGGGMVVHNGEQPLMHWCPDVRCALAAK